VKIKLINFRNYKSVEASFTEPVIIITGRNGSGKTNLLEAVSLLTPGKGLRGSELSEISHNNTGEWAINAELNGYNIGTGLEQGSSKRIVKIDGEKQRGANILAEYVSAIWLTPQMDGIFLESNSERRKFFDRIIYNFDPEHASRVAVYENAMRERLRLLKDESSDKIWLKTLEARMAEYGVAIAAARNEVIEYLQQELDKKVSSFPKPLIEIRGRYEDMLKNSSALEVEKSFSSDLLNSRISDYQSGRTHAGIHKTDFHVINTLKMVPANISSTGEQKALLLSIILAMARLLKTRKNKAPILLLDEVIAHLDESRRHELYAEIEAIGCQCFMTGTEKNLFSELANNVQFIEVSDGIISAQ